MPLEFENMTQDFTYCKYERIMVCCLFGIAGYQVLNHDTQAVSTLSVFLMSSDCNHLQCRYTRICALNFLLIV